MSEKGIERHPASFRDPSGFVFTHQGVLYRQVNKVFAQHYDRFINSGLYAALLQQGWIIGHNEVENIPGIDDGYKILRPEPIPFISYAYEWTFGMMKEAALLTLSIAKKALDFDMVLKDASPTNVQWNGQKMVFIDSLSFENYVEGTPWIAYRQFCECFLAPLLIMHHRKLPLHELQLAYPEGIPLAIATKLLPWKSRFSMLCYLHIHLHAKIAHRHQVERDKSAVLPKSKFIRLVNSLEMLVNNLALPAIDTTWGSYYAEAASREDYLEQKKKIVNAWISELPFCKTGIDIGTNDGTFAALLAEKNIETIAIDGDPAAISNLYEKIKAKSVKSLTPLIISLANPSPASGVNNAERSAFLKRARNRDIGLCLAVVHHLYITHHLSFELIADLLCSLCSNLLIEFVQPGDTKINEMVSHRNLVITGYSQEHFEEKFATRFKIVKKDLIPGSVRVLYFMVRK